jgi:hypothetical protein
MSVEEWPSSAVQHELSSHSCGLRLQYKADMSPFFFLRLFIFFDRSASLNCGNKQLALYSTAMCMSTPRCNVTMIVFRVMVTNQQMNVDKH